MRHGPNSWWIGVLVRELLGFIRAAVTMMDSRALVFGWTSGSLYVEMVLWRY